MGRCQLIVQGVTAQAVTFDAPLWISMAVTAPSLTVKEE